MITTGPAKPSSRRVAAALPPATPPPTITIGLPLVLSATESILPSPLAADEAGRVSGCGVDLLDELGQPVLIEVAGQVGLRNDADQTVVLDHRQVLDPVVFHLVQRLAHARA